MADAFERVTGARVAYADHPERGLIVARGADRVRFIDGMVSNDVAKLAPGESCYATLLDRKGHVLSDLDVIALEDEIWISTAEGRGAVVGEVLEKHLIADDVELEDRGGSFGELAFEGPDAREWLAGRGHAPPDADCARVDAAGRVWLGRGLLGPDGVRVLGPRESLAELVDGCPLLEASAHEVLRVERGIARYGLDVTDRNFPQEARLEHALSFDKGCYIGQEIVARLHSRGAINRCLVRLSLAEPVEPGTDIVQDGVRVGTVTSVATSPQGGAIALGYVRVDASAPQTGVDVGGVRGRVLEPPPGVATGS